MVWREQTMVWRQQTMVWRQQTISEAAQRIARSAEGFGYCVCIRKNGMVRLSGSEGITDGKVEDEAVTQFVDIIKARLTRSIGRVESDAEVEAQHQVA